MAMVPVRPTGPVVELKPVSLKMLKKARLIHVQGSAGALDTAKQARN